MEETSKTSENLEKPLRDENGRLLPNQQSLNPLGRPKGKTIKERVREFLEENPSDMKDFVNHFVKKNRDLAWQMLEGRPSQGIGQAEDLAPLHIISFNDNPVQVPTAPVSDSTITGV